MCKTAQARHSPGVRLSMNIVILRAKHQLGMIPWFIKLKLSLVWIRYYLQWIICTVCTACPLKKRYSTRPLWKLGPTHD